MPRDDVAPIPTEMMCFSIIFAMFLSARCQESIPEQVFVYKISVAAGSIIQSQLSLA